METLKHVELKGNYKNKKIIIDACQISANNFEIMAMYEDGEEINCKISTTKVETIAAFDTMINKYAEPLQKSIYNAGLVKGEKYTLVYYSEFGFPVADKITFDSFEFCTYAQYSDCIKMIFTLYRRRKIYQKYFYNTSFLIFEGWQELKEEDTRNIICNNATRKVTASKYDCFDSRYLDDIEKILKNPIVIYRK